MNKCKQESKYVFSPDFLSEISTQIIGIFQKENYQTASKTQRGYDWNIDLVKANTIVFFIIYNILKKEPDFFSLKNQKIDEITTNFGIIFMQITNVLMDAQKEKGIPFFEKNILFTKNIKEEND